MLALILAGGDAPTLPYLAAHWPRWAEDVGLVVAADGGARHAASLGVAIDLWAGDGDSIDAADLAALADAGVEIERASPDKDQTDTELAVRAALARDARGVIIVGATGGPRIDHELANLALLAMPELVATVVTCYTPSSRIRPLHGRGDDPIGGPARHVGAGPATVSLLPFGGDAQGVTTSGLRYPLHDETLPFGSPRGVSNEADGPWEVLIRDGSLLIVETPATIAR